MFCEQDDIQEAIGHISTFTDVTKGNVDRLQLVNVEKTEICIKGKDTKRGS